jgi:FtsH-binding integral membrane protein
MTMIQERGAGGGWVLPKRKRFVAHHRSDRTFFLLFLAACWLGVVMGFTPAVAKRWAGHADYPAPLILQVHAFAFTSWLLLLTAQIGLVRVRRVLVHQTLGLVGFALVPLMAVTALAAEVYSQRFHVAHPPNNFAFFILPIFYALGFAVLAGLALFRRRDPAAHKRLILLATTVIVGAAYARWWGDALTARFGDGYVGMLVNSFAGTDLLLFGAALYDFATRGRLHRVYEIGVPAILLCEIATSFVYHSPAWLPVAAVLVGR